MNNKTSQIYITESVIPRLSKTCILCGEGFEIPFPQSSELVCSKCKLMWKILQKDIFERLEDKKMVKKTQKLLKFQ